MSAAARELLSWKLSNGDFGVMFLDGVRMRKESLELDLPITDNHTFVTGAYTLRIE